MKIAAIFTGHLRFNAVDCINSAVKFLKQYSNNIDLFINTYDVIGGQVNSKDYTDIENKYIQNYDASINVIKKIEEKFCPVLLKVNNYEDFQKEIVLPKTKNLINKINQIEGPALKNPGLLSGVISQLIQKKEMFEFIGEDNFYDALLLTRPDVNFTNLKKFELGNSIYHVQNVHLGGKPRNVFINSNQYMNRLSKKFKIGLKKENLIGEILFFGLFRNVSTLNTKFYSKIDEAILNIYKESSEYMTFVHGKDFENIPNWEMPEYMYSVLSKSQDINFEKVAYFNIFKAENKRHYEFIEDA